MTTAEIYLSSTAYNALFETTIGAGTFPSSTNYDAIENYFANWLNGKLRISTALTTDPSLSMARLWVGYAITEFSQYNKGRSTYVSPETFVNMPIFIERMEKYNMLVVDIENMIYEDGNREPAWSYEFDRYGGGAIL